MSGPNPYVDKYEKMNPLDRFQFEGIVQQIGNQVQQNLFLVGPVETAKSIHLFIDERIEATKKKFPISCKKGCSFCCYIQAIATDGEAELMLQGTTLSDSQIEQLKIQAGKSFDEFNKLPYQKKRCAFLVNDECSVYDRRPSVCRGYMVNSKPSLCNTQYKRQPVALVSPTSIEAAQAAYMMNHNVKYGSIADMILQQLNKKP